MCPWSNPTTNNPAAKIIDKTRIPKTGIVDLDFVVNTELFNEFQIVHNYITCWIDYPIYIINNVF